MRRTSALLAALAVAASLAAAPAAALAAEAPAGAAAGQAAVEVYDASTEEMHRLYNPYTGEHFYTASVVERDSLASVGWSYEGVGWTAPAESSTPVYRLYNRYAPGGDHHYTTSEAEYASLAAAGWRQEGVAWYSDDDEGTPLYRQYNPYAATGTHNYTASALENDSLVSLGWRAEGVGWYGVSEAKAGETVSDVSYRDGVVVVEGYSQSGGSYTFASDVDVEVGDMVALVPAGGGVGSVAGTVLSVSKDGGETAVTLRPADKLEDVFTAVDISASGVASSLQYAEFADGVEVVDEGSPTAYGAVLDPIKLTLPEGSLGEGCKGSITLTLTPSVDADVKWSALGGFDLVRLDFECDSVLEGKISAEKKSDASVPIARLPFELPWGFVVWADLYLDLSASGEVTVGLSVDPSCGVAYRKSTGLKPYGDAGKFDPSISGSGTIRAGIAPDLLLGWGAVDIIDLKAKAGCVTDGDMVVRETGLVCVDADSCFYLSLSAGEETGWLKLLKLSLDTDIYDQSNSPFKSSDHFENGKKVKECTYGKDAGGDSGSGGGGSSGGGTSGGGSGGGGGSSWGDGGSGGGGGSSWGGTGDGGSSGGVVLGVSGQTVSLSCVHSAAISSDGTLWMWGENKYGQLGDGTTNDSSTPVKIMENIVAVSLGYGHSAAIASDGSLWTWGSNGYGQLGDGTTTDSSTPVKVMDDVVAVSLGYYHSAAIRSDGTLWMWGANHYGQLDDGTTTNRPTPVKVMDGVASVSLRGEYSAAIKSDGSLWMWGINTYGQLGDRGMASYNEPVEVMDNVAAVSLGIDHAAAIKTDGSLWTWGNNAHGELGYVTTTIVNAYPAKVMDDVVDVSLGYGHSAALKADGSLWTWGRNDHGQLGDGETTSRSTPAKVMDGVVDVFLGNVNSAILKSDGSLWTWGWDEYGQLGDGTTTDRSTPVKVMDDVALPDTSE